MIDLDSPAAWDGEGLSGAVSDAERVRAARFRLLRDATRWLRARAALRQILAAAIDVAPLDIAYALSSSGKPSVEGSHRVEFNLAHSGARALVATSRNGGVGVDVEVVRAGLREAAILERVLGSTGRTRWDGAPTEQRTDVFFREWVRFEAAVKCRGTTIADSFDVDVGLGLTIVDLDLGEPYAAAAAHFGDPVRFDVAAWNWPTRTS
ncbi:MAG: 4'-phosphopantetheinyl transferase family protein [Acidimicrobiales bacterium]